MSYYWLLTFTQQTISARERALCQLTVCFEFLRSEIRKGHKSCALQMLFGSTELTVKVQEIGAKIYLSKIL